MKDATLRGSGRFALKFPKAAEARHGMSKLESLQEGSECPLHGPVTVNYNLPWKLQCVSDARSMRLSIKESYRLGVGPVGQQRWKHGASQVLQIPGDSIPSLRCSGHVTVRYIVFPAGFQAKFFCCFFFFFLFLLGMGMFMLLCIETM